MRRASRFFFLIFILTLAGGSIPSGASGGAAGPVDDPDGWRWTAFDPAGWRWD